MPIEIERVAIVIGSAYQQISLFLVGMPFLAFSSMIEEDAVEFAKKNFPTVTITLLDRTQLNPQVVIIQKAT